MVVLIVIGGVVLVAAGFFAIELWSNRCPGCGGWRTTRILDPLEEFRGCASCKTVFCRAVGGGTWHEARVDYTTFARQAVDMY